MLEGPVHCVLMPERKIVVDLVSQTLVVGIGLVLLPWDVL